MQKTAKVSKNELEINKKCLISCCCLVNLLTNSELNSHWPTHDLLVVGQWEDRIIRGLKCARVDMLWFTHCMQIWMIFPEHTVCNHVEQPCYKQQMA